MQTTTLTPKTFDRNAVLTCPKDQGLLTPGRAGFKVLSLEWTKSSRYNCEAVKIKFRLRNESGFKTIDKTLVLNEKSLWMISDLFKAVGLVSADAEQLKPDWDGLIGRTGLCKVTMEPWHDETGKEHQSNAISKFLRPQVAAEELPIPARPAEPTRNPDPDGIMPPQGSGDEIPF